MGLLPFEIEKRMKDIEEKVGLLGAELVDVEYKTSQGRPTLVFVVDKAGGITLEDCVNINNGLSLWFEELEAGSGAGQDFLKGPYNLEVNSPGLDRPLKKARDFARAIGVDIRVVWRDERDKVMVTSGRVCGTKDGVLEINSGKGPGQKIGMAQIIRANREVGFRSP